MLLFRGGTTPFMQQEEERMQSSPENIGAFACIWACR